MIDERAIDKEALDARAIGKRGKMRLHPSKGIKQLGKKVALCNCTTMAVTKAVARKEMGLRRHPTV